jgi:hypothetical protein
MVEKYEQLYVGSDSFEPFVLCLALGTLEAMKTGIWSSEAGIWTIGRPDFLEKLEELNVSEETINVLVQFDELNALEKFGGREDFERELLKIEDVIKKRLEDFSENFWNARWSREVSES